jgi:hypothetical protein
MQRVDKKSKTFMIGNNIGIARAGAVRFPLKHKEL